MTITGFGRAQAAYEAREPDDVAEECPDQDCGEWCPGCQQAAREDDFETKAEAARDDARLGL